MASILEKESVMYVPELEDTCFCSIAGFNMGFKTLASLPLGIIFYNGGSVFRFEGPIKEERAIMKKSVAERREYSLVKTGDKIRIVSGYEFYIPREESLKALEIVENDGEGCLDSHTHWKTRLGEAKSFPLQSICDFFYWIDLREKYPLIECRIALWAGNKIGILNFIGRYKDLYGERFKAEEHRRFIIPDTK